MKVIIEFNDKLCIKNSENYNEIIIVLNHGANTNRVEAIVNIDDLKVALRKLAAK